MLGSGKIVTPVDVRLSLQTRVDDPGRTFYLIERGWIITAYNDRAIDYLSRRIAELMAELNELCIDPEINP